MTRGRVIGVGSPFGADRAGWDAVEALRSCGFAGRFPEMELEIADRPGSRLVERFSGVPLVILFDALIGGEPGRLRVVDPGALAGSEAGYSSHGFGVAEAVALAGALGEMPEQLVIIGIEVGGDPHWQVDSSVAGRIESLLSARGILPG